MIEIPSRLEGKTFLLNVLEQQLKPLGYVIGGNWDYDHGSFDYKMADDVGYQFLRLPFVAVDGQLDSYGATVELKRPYVLCHKYQRGLDDNVHIGNLNASFNQFSEPEDPDATVPDQYVAMAKTLIKDLEERLL